MKARTLPLRDVKPGTVFQAGPMWPRCRRTLTGYVREIDWSQWVPGVDSCGLGWEDPVRIVENPEGRVSGTLLGARITIGVRESLDECSSCCLDDADDRKRVERAVLERVAEAFEKHQRGE